MKQKSFAKINLFLEVVDYQAPFHILNSFIAFIDLCDKIKIIKSKSFNMRIKGPYKNKLNSKNNIITKTIDIMRQRFNIVDQFSITLTKNIPISAGIGGGSSNAATVILMLNQIYNLKLDQSQLTEIGFSIGADVPFFLNQKAAIVQSAGDKFTIAKYNFKKQNILIINPNLELSTKKVFESFQKKYFTKEPFVISKKIDNLLDYIQKYQNDLTTTAIEILPEIKDILQQLKQQDGCIIARMSGSGATCFAFFKNENLIDLAKTRLQQYFPNFYISKHQLLFGI